MAQIFDTGVEENTNVGADWNADVFPNPIAGSLYIRSSNGDDNLNVKIMDVNGSLVYSQNLTNANSASIDVSSLKAAIYFVEIQNSDGKLVRKKLIKLD
jgi:LEA14-like dessication related protein